MALEQETAYFESKRADLLEHYRGQFVLIHEDRLLGGFVSFEEAFAVGIQTVGNRPFLIKQVAEEEQQEQFPTLALGLISAHVS
jgi:hypothetical protein